MNLDNHPCFNKKACKDFGRVHLPVAPRCNIQCKFCNRKFDCVNESRPGVTSGVLTPAQAMIYLEEVFKSKKNISVVGIAGPGDPFANADETLETLRLVREKYPDMLLCVATNGLNLNPYLDDLARLDVTHITVTVNAVDVAVAENIYSWVRYGKRALNAKKGAALLLENQLSAIRGLKERGLTVKVNTIILPGINEDHIEDVAIKMAELDVDILNCVPYHPSSGSAFENLLEPSPETVNAIREKASHYVKQMRHCTRCRADAVGLLGEKPDTALMQTLQACETMNAPVPKTPCKRLNVAVASMEGVLVNQHLGEASKLLIYGKKHGTVTLLDARQTPQKGMGLTRWEQLADVIGDCGTLLVSGIGDNPKQVLSSRGIDIMEIEGLIEDAVRALFEGKPLNHMIKRNLKPCGAGCSGNAIGCS